MPKRFLTALAILGILTGILLRFAWTSDMEYKYDERYMFTRSQVIGVTEPWPAVGMASGVGTANPGMSTWIFVALARVTHANTPLALDRSVIALNCLALLLLGLLIFRIIAPEEREAWTWGLALVAVNPFALLIQRKIWAQSTLPFFCVLFIWGWLRRESRWGALVWGLIGAILGQIHMSGFFFSAAVLLWSIWDARANKKRVAWGAWLVGSVIGAIPLIPWLRYMLSAPRSTAVREWSEILNFRFWEEWAKQISGMSLRYSLGVDDFSHFTRMPEITGHPTYLVGMFCLVSVISAAAILLIALVTRTRKPKGETQVLQDATFWGFGGLMTAARIYVWRHYLVVTYPLQFVWVSRLALRREKSGRVLLLLLWTAQFVISAACLCYIHEHGGAGGDYGPAYSAQANP
jgi:hypothetical protein